MHEAADHGYFLLSWLQLHLPRRASSGAAYSTTTKRKQQYAASLTAVESRASLAVGILRGVRVRLDVLALHCIFCYISLPLLLQARLHFWNSTNLRAFTRILFQSTHPSASGHSGLVLGSSSLNSPPSVALYLKLLLPRFAYRH